MPSLRRIAGPVAALGLFVSLGACSSAPEPASEQTGKTSSDLVRPGACWMRDPGGCSIDSTPSTPKLFSFEWMLQAVYGCQPTKGYRYGMGAEEAFTMCPSTPGLASYLANFKPDFALDGFILGPHEAPNACDKCLWPAPAGWVYVFWTSRFYIPICSGNNCGFGGW